MRARAVSVLLFAFAACAGSAAPSREPTTVSATSAEVALRIRELAAFTTAEQMRGYLEAGLQTKELHRVGFDQVTIAQCVDRVIAAVQDSRQRPGDALAIERLEDSVDLFVAARQEAIVRRYAGAANCLPTAR